jgi:hypothetical protein
MNNFPKFMVGNIVKSPEGTLWIVTDIDEKYMSGVSFDYTNTTLGCSKETKKRGKHHCDCIEYDEANPDCADCKGTGEVDSIFHGYDEYEFVASTVKDFIQSKLLKIFNI